MKTKNRGAVQVILIAAAAIVLGIVLLVPSWHLPAFLQKKPPLQQLSTEQVQLQKAQTDLAVANAQLQAVKDKELVAKNSQLTYAQTMTTGAAVALSQVPPAHQTPEVKLAEQLVTKANAGLDAALGALPADQALQIKGLVMDALSAKQSEVDAANAKLAEMTTQFNQVSDAKLTLERQVPALQAQVSTDKAVVAAKDQLVTQTQAQVNDWAAKKTEADQKAGSLEAYGKNLMHIVIIIGLVWLLVHFVLPSVTAEFPANSALSVVYRLLGSIFSAHTISVPAKVAAVVAAAVPVVAAAVPVVAAAVPVVAAAVPVVAAAVPVVTPAVPVPAPNPVAVAIAGTAAIPTATPLASPLTP